MVMARFSGTIFLAGCAMVALSIVGVALLLVNSRTGTPPPTSTTTSRPTSTPDQVSAADRVQACELHHNLHQQHDRLGPGRVFTIFADCAWPSPTYADNDGHSEISVTTTTGAPGASEAQGDTL